MLSAFWHPRSHFAYGEYPAACRLQASLTRSAPRMRTQPLAFARGVASLFTEETFVRNIETRAEDFEECKRIFTEAKETVTIDQTNGNCHLASDIKTMQKPEQPPEKRLTLWGFVIIYV